MALKRNETYPGRFGNPTSDHPQGAFKNRSAPGAQDGSFCEQQWANDWDGFFGRLLTLAGISPDGEVDTASSSQYYDALKSLFLQRTDPFGDIKSDGESAVSAALSNLGLGGLGSGSALPVGIPVPWPTATPPTGWIKCNGASFSASEYPQLAVIFPALVLPDLRGEFIRGWDDSRGIDAGRTLLSGQLGTFVSVDINYEDSGLVGVIGTAEATGGIANVNGDTITTPLTKIAFQYASVAGMVATTALPGNTVATRPRNVAFNFIVRAA